MRQQFAPKRRPTVQLAASLCGHCTRAGLTRQVAPLYLFFDATDQLVLALSRRLRQQARKEQPPHNGKQHEACVKPLSSCCRAGQSSPQVCYGQRQFDLFRFLIRCAQKVRAGAGKEASCWVGGIEREREGRRSACRCQACRRRCLRLPPLQSQRKRLAYRSNQMGQKAKRENGKVRKRAYRDSKLKCLNGRETKRAGSTGKARNNRARDLAI